MTDTTRAWLVERTYSDDEQNLIILTYAPDGERYFRKERALPSFTGAHRETPVSVTVEDHNHGTVDDLETRQRYTAEVERMQSKHDADDSL